MDVALKVSGAITGVVPYLGSFLIRHGSYRVCYKRNVNDLKKQMAILRQLKADVLRSVGIARMRGDVIRDVVEGWLTRVIQMQFSETALSHALEDSKGCLQGGCCWRYQVGKDAKQMIDQVNELLNEGRTLNAVSDPAPLPPSLETIQSLYFQVYDSTKLAMDQIMEALKHEDVNMVGVYGLGGVGKTTMMKEVAKILKKDRVFDQVVMFTVSQDPVLMKIQGEIAENLGLKLEEMYSLDVRARRILERLKKEKRILIILDDLWKPLNLVEQVGIPYGKNCKVVLTTRQFEVCTQMETQFNVELKVLSEDDAWVLFNWAAGVRIRDHNILYQLAKQIVRECGGLPLVIVTIGRALRAKDRSMWEDVANQLKKSSSSPPDIEGVHEKVFCSIKLSFDFLASDATKFCLLLCCMFPEDSPICEDDLLPYVVGEGVFGDIDTLMEVRNRLHTQMERLKGSCLLMDYHSDRRKGCVKMHDVIRDVSIWIASKEGHDFVVKSGKGLTHFPDREKILLKCKRLSLMQNKISNLPNRLDYCSQLMTLSLRHNVYLREIPDSFFEGMASLKTLDLERTRISSLPSSLSCLTDLRVLCISGRSSDIPPLNVSLVGKLKKLEILQVHDPTVKKLPKEIGELTNLKSLDLSTNPGLVIVPNTLSRLSLLEEVNLMDSIDEWGMEGSEEGRSKACLSEIASLSALTTLNMRVSNINCLCANIPCKWENLTRFSVSILENREYLLETDHPRYVSECTTSVYIDRSSIPPLANWVRIYLLERAEGLQFNKCRGLKHFLSLGAMGFNNLRILCFDECEDMEYLLRTSVDESELELEVEVPHIVFSSLECLYMLGLPELKAICHGSFPSGCFNNLRILAMSHCPLTPGGVIASDMLVNLPNLEELQVFVCLEPTEVFNSKGLEEGQATMTKLKKLDVRAVPDLRTIWEGIVSPLSLLKLEGVCMGAMPKLKSMFSLAMAQRLQQLKQLEIRWCENMVRIISMVGDDEINTQIRSSSKQSLNSSSSLLLLPTPPIFGNLRRLCIRNCDSLKHILPMSLAQGLPQLEELDIRDCRNLEEIIVNDADIEKEAICKMVFPQLRYLVLAYLPNLSMVSKGVLHHDWPSLEALQVWECPNFKRFLVSLKTATKLREIHVKEEWFNGLKWDDDQTHDKLLHLPERVQVKFDYDHDIEDDDEEYAFDSWAFGPFSERSPPTSLYYSLMD